MRLFFGENAVWLNPDRKNKNAIKNDDRLYDTHFTLYECGEIYCNTFLNLWILPRVP